MEQRSARRLVTPEAVGSNPIEGAFEARYANRQSGEAQTFVIVWVRLPPVLFARSIHQSAVAEASRLWAKEPDANPPPHDVQ